MVDAREIRDALRDWILERAGAPLGTRLRDETPILAEGLLSSLDVVELVLFIEDLRGGEVDTEAIEPESLRDINTLYAVFFEKAGGLTAQDSLA